MDESERGKMVKKLFEQGDPQWVREWTQTYIRGRITKLMTN